jgi:hypothetical protein
MLFRKTLVTLALAGAVIPAAFADTGCVSTSADGGCSTPQYSTTSTTSRAQVKQELAAYQKDAAASNATNWASADGGYSTPQFNTASTTSRAQVKQELAAYQKASATPVPGTYVSASADGGGYTVPLASYAVQGGHLVRTDRMGQDAVTAGN